MITPREFEEVWEKGDYRRGSTCQRLVPLLSQLIPKGSTINDYGSGTGRAEILLLEKGYSVNMVDFASNALEEATRALIDGERLTYCISPLECLPDDFPKAEWGICINVLMTVDPDKLDSIMGEMRRTCDNIIIEFYDRPDVRLGKDLTTVKGDMAFWNKKVAEFWPFVVSMNSPEQGRYITIGTVNAPDTV